MDEIKKENEDKKPDLKKNSDNELSSGKDCREKSYYYDDAYNYEIYKTDNDTEDSE